MTNLEHVQCNRTTTSWALQATTCRAGCTPVLRVAPVAQAGDKPITESNHSRIRHAATAGDHEVDLTDEAPSTATDHSASPLVTQHFATLGHPTPVDSEAPLLENSYEELEYIRCKNARL